MNFKDLLGKLDQLNEAEMTSRKVSGKAYGGSAQDDDDDEEGEKKAPADVVKRGRGRPRKAGGDAQVKAGYGGAAELQNWMVGNIPKKSKELSKLPVTKHKLSDKDPTEKKKVKESLKDWIAELDQLMETEQLTIQPADQKTQVIKQGTKTLGQVSNPQLANTIKQAIGKGEMSLAGVELGESADQQLRLILADAATDSDALYELMSSSSPAGRIVQDMYNNIAGETGLHPDDDFEKILDIVADQLEENFANQGVAEGNNSSPFDGIAKLKSKSNKELAALIVFWEKVLEKTPDNKTANDQLHIIKMLRSERIGKEGVAEGYSLKKTRFEKTLTPGDPDEYYSSGGADVTTKDTDYEIINNKTGQVVGVASWTTNDYFGAGAMKITMNNGATRYLDIWEREKGNPQTAFNRFVKDPKTAKKYKEQDVDEGLPQTLRKYVPGYAKKQIDNKIKDEQFTQIMARDGDPTDPQNQKDISQTRRNIRRLNKVGQQGVAEGKNHMDETEYNTYAGWKAACRKAGADKFDGDRDICQAMKDGKGVGEWDGEKGSVYDDSHKKKKITDGAKAKKTKVAEGIDQQLKAAHHQGKAHALAKEGYNCRYNEGSEEARMYHEGYKMGLDECYGATTTMDVVGSEEVQHDTGDDMARFGAMGEDYSMMEDDMEEGNAFTAALAKTPPGGKFSVGGETFTDRSGYDAKVDEMMMAFEGWDKELNALLTEGDKVSEGMSVSVSKGQQGLPDSVSITASDSEADKLMSLVRQMGVFGNDDPVGDVSNYGAAQSDQDVVHQHGDLTVVDDHDGMMALIKKVSGPEGDSTDDYADEVDSEENPEQKEMCQECGGMMEEGHGCGSDKEMVDEVEDTDEDELEESFANSADDTFEADMEFMTKVISGGLNKQKSTGQSTTPVIPGQKDRMGVDGMKEGASSLLDWKKLAGLK